MDKTLQVLLIYKKNFPINFASVSLSNFSANSFSCLEFTFKGKMIYMYNNLTDCYPNNLSFY